MLTLPLKTDYICKIRKKAIEYRAMNKLRNMVRSGKNELQISPLK